MRAMFSDDNYKPFAIVRDVEPSCVTLHVFGDVDLSTAGELTASIDEVARNGDSLLINLSKCRYFDSSGLAALVEARKLLGGRLTILVEPKSQVLRVIYLVGFDKLFNVVTELQTSRGGVAFLEGRDPSFIRTMTTRSTQTLRLAAQT